jgi:hypothetical protein
MLLLPSAGEEELAGVSALFLPLRATEMDGAGGSSPEPAVALEDERA